MNTNKVRKPNKKKETRDSLFRKSNTGYYYLEDRFPAMPDLHKLCFTCRMINPSCVHDKIQISWRIRIPRKTSDFRWRQLEKFLSYKN